MKKTYKRATTEAQKREVIERLYNLWKANPSLRLGQLIGNVYYFPAGIDPYHEEDYDFIKKLEDVYGD